MTVDFRREVKDELPYLRRFAFALTGSMNRADDLVVESLQRARSRLHLFDPDNGLRTWLFSILRNRCLEALAKHPVAPRHIDVANVSYGESGPVHADMEHVMVLDVVRGLDTLPLEQKEILLLVGMEGFTYEEAADVIGATVGTVISRLSRARKRLRTVAEENERQAQDALIIVEGV